MRKTILPAFAFLALSFASAAFSQATPPPPPAGVPPTVGTVLTAKPVTSYKDVLDFLPKTLGKSKPPQWTDAQKQAANAALNDALTIPKTPVKMRLKVSEIADWGGLKLFSDVPNREGYKVMVFAQFLDSSKLETLKKGDSILLEGKCGSVSFTRVWTHFALSICVDDSKFNK